MRYAIASQTRFADYSLHSYHLVRRAGIVGLLDQCIDKTSSKDHEAGHWQSSLASVRKLGDTFCIEHVSFRLPLPW